MPCSFRLDRSWSDVLPLLRGSLEGLGLRLVETFDLQTARLALTGCTCPYHGTADCDCQMVVLMVYGEAAAPAALMLHGNDGQTWVSLPETGARGAPDPLLEQALELAVRHIRLAEGL